MEVEAIASEVGAEDKQQAEAVTGSMDDTTTAVEDTAADTTPPEPALDSGWTDDEDEQKWNVLLDRTQCQCMTAHSQQRPQQLCSAASLL